MKVKERKKETAGARVIRKLERYFGVMETETPFSDAWKNAENLIMKTLYGLTFQKFPKDVREKYDLRYDLGGVSYQN